MIDRSYLPFPDARQYHDRKMAKWMGFFLSEHTSALKEDSNKASFKFELSFEEKLLLLNQLYVNQLTSCIRSKYLEQTISYFGTVSTVNNERILLKSMEGYVPLKLADILTIELVEEFENETA
ncbi:hypothetical protein D8880_10835 [Streptococcus sanguinis]|uniref:hypothetical protein n=1 Tax=Streptococcus sanguinis TaxID=1305 RepID=UPI000F675434|nr:hypothetical protein [Streptococcus sanguinis]RSI22841.1 hypothetical protein D8880_10835 [Streptococcus sanguinis]